MHFLRVIWCYQPIYDENLCWIPRFWGILGDQPLFKSYTWWSATFWGSHGWPGKVFLGLYVKISEECFQSSTSFRQWYRNKPSLTPRCGEQPLLKGCTWWSAISWEKFVEICQFLRFMCRHCCMWWSGTCCGLCTMISHILRVICSYQPLPGGYEQWSHVMIRHTLVVICSDQPYLDGKMWWSATFRGLYVVINHVWSIICGDKPLFEDYRSALTAFWGGGNFWWLASFRGIYVTVSQFLRVMYHDQKLFELFMVITHFWRLYMVISHVLLVICGGSATYWRKFVIINHFKSVIYSLQPLVEANVLINQFRGLNMVMS